MIDLIGLGLVAFVLTIPVALLQWLLTDDEEVPL